MSTHTPGPWHVKLNSGFHEGQPFASVWIEAGPYTSIASLIPHHGVEGNARLIAASPDLLDALRAFCGDYESTPTTSDTSLKAAYLHALTVIAKVKGESS